MMVKQGIQQTKNTSAEQKDIKALYNLGVMYMDGQGVAANMEKAREQFQQIVDTLKPKDQLLSHFSKLTLPLDQHDENLKDIKQWIGLLAQDQLRMLDEKAAKQELEDIMAMFAHKFRGPLQNILYNIKHENQKKRTTEAVRTMTGLLNIFGTISTRADDLRKKILKDKQGDNKQSTVLVKSLSLAITQLLTVNNMDKIVQHYLGYAKKNAQVPRTATREQLMYDYLDIWENLQAEWENSFMQLVAKPDDLTRITTWVQERFFPIQIVGFDDNQIHFKRYGVTESVLIIVMTEILLNAVKYYGSTSVKPVIVRWEFQKYVCKFVCENPTSQIERDSSKGSYKGHTFLNIIARKLQGNFAQTLVQDYYRAEFSLPSYLLTA